MIDLSTLQCKGIRLTILDFSCLPASFSSLRLLVSLIRHSWFRCSFPHHDCKVPRLWHCLQRSGFGVGRYRVPTPPARRASRSERHSAEGKRYEEMAGLNLERAQSLSVHEEVVDTTSKHTTSKHLLPKLPKPLESTLYSSAFPRSSTNRRGTGVQVGR